MNYHNITKDDMLNGDGLRVVLWVSGCTHHCHNCQNPITWDVAGGLPFDEAAEKESALKTLYDIAAIATSLRAQGADKEEIRIAINS